MIYIESEGTMKHLENPICMAPDQEGDSMRGICGIRMNIIGERHPLWQPRFYTFECPRCGCIRSIDESKAGRYSEEI
jgi:hypothetical protein